MFKVAVGHGLDPDSRMAIKEAIEVCKSTLGDDTPQAGILLCAIDFDHTEILRCLHETFPDLQLIGGTTVGEMSSQYGFQEDSLTLMLFASDEIEMHIGLGQGVSADPLGATQQSLSHVEQTSPVKLCYAISEGLGSDGVSVVDGLRAVLGDAVPILGGLAADGWQFKQSYQFFKDQVLTDAVITLTFSGNLKVSCGVATGLQPIGPKGTVTKATGNTLYQINQESAQACYQRYFGAVGMDLGGGGNWGGAVAVFEPGEERFYVRSPNSQQDEAAGSINYFGSIPEQAEIQFTETTTEALLEAASGALAKAKAAYSGKSPQAALMVSCASRLKSLGTRAKEEHQLAQTMLGDLPNMGFHAYGEICPLVTEGRTYFHNETFAAILGMRFKIKYRLN